MPHQLEDVARTRADHTAHRVARSLGLDARSQSTLADAYRVAYEYPAPLITRIADDMLSDLHADVGSCRTNRVVCLGRDGHSLAIAMNRLDRSFFRRHCSNVVLSRAVVENALQDLEHHQGRTFPDAKGFRRVASQVRASDTVGGLRALTDYLQAHRVPVGSPGSRVTLVDSSFKGTVQELLTAIYPETAFTGRYAFYGESPHDRHPGSKKGYEVHLSASQSRGGLPLNVLPDDESKTFAHQVAIGTIEETLNGPMTSPLRIDSGRPLQTGLHNESDHLEGLDHGLVSPRLRSPTVREGVKVVNLLAVADHAQDVSSRRDAGHDYRLSLESGARRFRAEVRNWIAGEATTDPRLKEFLDSFVKRSDKRHAAALHRTLKATYASAAQADAIWAGYGRCGTDDDKRIYVENVLSSTHPAGGMNERSRHERFRRDQGLAGTRRTGREIR